MFSKELNGKCQTEMSMSKVYLLLAASAIAPVLMAAGAHGDPLPRQEALAEALTVVAGPGDLSVAENAGRLVEEGGKAVYAELLRTWGVQWHWPQDKFVPGLPYRLSCEFYATRDYALSWGNGPTFACWNLGARQSVTGTDGQLVSVTVPRDLLRQEPDRWREVEIGTFEPAAAPGYAYVSVQERALELLHTRGGAFPRIRSFRAVPVLDDSKRVRELLAQWRADHPLIGDSAQEEDAEAVDRVRAAVRALPATEGENVRLAHAGNALAVVVCPADATYAERMACEELQHYLEAVTGATFPVAGTVPDGVPVIALGRAAAGLRHVRTSLLSPQAWRIETDAGSLYLYGGAFRGTLYAVYQFLEDVVGVHWWNAFEETVPRREDLTLPRLTMAGEPAFRLRSLETASQAEAGSFAGRNRAFRGFSPVEGFGKPRFVHSLPNYLGRTRDLVRTHPDWIAQTLDGKPNVDSETYNLLHPGVRAETVRKLRVYIQQDRQDADLRRDRAPWTYVISPADGGVWNDSSEAQALLAREGSRAGELLDFINHVADAVADEHPDIVVSTLAYLDSRFAPRTLRPRPNVEIRYCTETMNMVAPLTDTSNRAACGQMQDWFRMARHRALWFYEECWWGERGLPIPNEWYFADRLRLVRQLGADSIFKQNMGLPVLAEMRDMKSWLYLKLMEDPFQDTEELLETFAHGYSGPAAGPQVVAYRQLLRQAEERHPSVVTMHARLPDLRYLTLDVLLAANRLLGEAADAVADDDVLSRRVRHARLGVDRALAFRYPDLVRDWVTAGNQARNFPIGLDAVIERMRGTWAEQCSLRYRPEDRKPLDEAMDELDRLSGNGYVPLPLPEGIGEERCPDTYDHTAGSPWLELDVARLALEDDSTTPVGRAVVLRGFTESDLTVMAGDGREIGRIGIAALPAGTWNWLRLPGVAIGSNAAARLALLGGALTARFRTAGRFDLWLHLRQDGDGDAAALRLDRVLLVRTLPPKIVGTLALPSEWTVFAPFAQDDPVPPSKELSTIPVKLVIGEASAEARPVAADDGELDFAGALGGTIIGRTAYAFLEFACPAEGEYTFGFGADWWFQAWIDGQPLIDTMPDGNRNWPPTCSDHLAAVRLTRGRHVLMVRFVSGSGSSMFAAAGPDDLRKAYGATAPVLMTAGAQEPTASYYLVGNSLTWDTMPPRLDGDVQWHVVCGKNLPYIHKNPDEFCVTSSKLWPEALTTKQYDFLSVQPYYGSTPAQDVDVISSWIDLQPKAIVVIHTGWARHATRKEEYENNDISGHLQHSPAYYSALLAELRKKHPKRTFRQTHAIDLLAKIAADIEAGKAPLKDVVELYRDDCHMGHQTGSYLMHNAMRHALGQPFSDKGFVEIDPGLKKYLDQVLATLQ